MSARTKAILLAAGCGERLRPLTERRPKCLVELAGRPLLAHLLEVLGGAGIEDVAMVTGHASEALAGWPVRRIHNPLFATTGIIESLAAARAEFERHDDVLISYTDIVYEPRVLDALLDCEADCAVAIDTDWEPLWRLRMDDVLSDAESLAFDRSCRIADIGGCVADLGSIDGRYVGLVRLRGGAVREFLRPWDAIRERLGANADRNGRFERLDMTRYLGLLASAGAPIHAAPVERGWLEVDTVTDLQRYEAAYSAGTLDRFWRPSRCDPGACS